MSQADDIRPPPTIAALRAADDAAHPGYASMNEYQKGTFARQSFVDQVLTPPEKLEMLNREHARMFRDIGADQNDIDHAIAVATANRRNPPTDAHIAAQNEEALQLLKGKYGKDAHQALIDARQLAKRDPRFAKLLESTGVGNSPRFIVSMAERARSERARGRLK